MTFYYIISIRGFETYIPVTVSHQREFSTTEFEQMVHDALVGAMRDGWIPDDYDAPGIAAKWLSSIFGFDTVHTTQECSMSEFTLHRWTGAFRMEWYNPTWRHKPIRPAWVPPDVADAVEAMIKADRDKTKQ